MGVTPAAAAESPVIETDNGSSNVAPARKRQQKRTKKSLGETGSPRERGGSAGEKRHTEEPAPIKLATSKPEKKTGDRGEIRNTPKPKRRRPSRSSAVTITCPVGGLSYAELIRKAQDVITLEEIGINNTRMQNTVAGGVVIELPGEDSSPAADVLASRLRETLHDTGVKIGRPMLRGDLRLSGIDASVQPNELAEAVANTGGCNVENVKMGSFRITRNGMRTVWLQCPLWAATKLAELGNLRVGWSTSRVELLKQRPLQCFKCFAVGHVRDRCPSKVDRSGNCFNCGESGHVARNCGKPPSCSVCKERNLRHDHRAGLDVCQPCVTRNEILQNSGKDKERMANRSTLATSSNKEILNDPRWACSAEATPLAAVTWQGSDSSAGTLLYRGDGFVVVHWRGVVVVSCYFSPNRRINEFRAYLNRISDAIRDRLGGPVLVLGDFNARSRLWDNTRQNIRGDAILAWASRLDLRLLNQGREYTCVRPQGRSVVDLSWASPAALGLIRSWNVAGEEESLSDHKYIFIEIGGKRTVEASGSRVFPRWNMRTINPDILRACLATYFWPAQRSADVGAEEGAARLQAALTEASNASIEEA
ncbi:PREDICTED: uncharacterized protein LOC105462786 [Wasmannia auropunctata]|uniref:uncharacterized protein LOC105462786 n=1 Tax=Wasmannia auropunctata TaxID=64793 RepID=UPI0005EE883A|nr:PREDICTED: uncharacterized protein LOC105462786 [Wasmannia auropunctata]